MRIRTLERVNYMIPGRHTLNLPDKGLVLITGDNGSGKSSWIDATATAWNTTARSKARKARGNLPNKSAKVLLETYEGLRVTRNWSKDGKAGLDWSLDDYASSGTTRSKTQKALDEQLGDFLVWRWSCVFSTVNANTFTVATPAQRREILETLLDLDLLARAYDVAHQDAKDKSRDIVEAERVMDIDERERAAAAEALSSAKNSRASLQPPAPAPPPMAPVLTAPPTPANFTEPEPPAPPKLRPAPVPPCIKGGESVQTLAQLVSEHTIAVQAAYARSTDLAAARDALDRDLAVKTSASLEAARLRDSLSDGKCPTCEQDITEACLNNTNIKCEETTSAVESARLALDDVQARLKCAQADLSALRAELGTAQEALRAAELEQTMFQRDQVRYSKDMEDYAREKRTLAEHEARTVASHKAQVAALRKAHEDRVTQRLTTYHAHVIQLQQAHERAMQAWDAAEKNAQEQHRQSCARLDALVQAAHARMDAAEVALASSAQEVRNLRESLALIRAASAVLGPAGTRSILLGQAQGAIEQAANRWLAELGTSQRIRLTAEGKDLGLEIVVGDLTKEYTDLSNGEGRRVDLAVALALGEVAACTRGGLNNGTLFLDEFLDGIDQTGWDAACALVTKLSRERCVVVITHREEISSRLRPDLSVVMRG
ncbi:MAG: hypothetical protein E6R03_08460 [Hyphomicrobiaceae bacterium]|nr:MAG: hypothetical protein E6R03_08460 [Hyphomicrobiaceae bacterium]